MKNKETPNLYELGNEPEETLREKDRINIRAHEENQAQKITTDQIPCVFETIRKMFGTKIPLPQVPKGITTKPIVYPYGA